MNPESAPHKTPENVPENFDYFNESVEISPYRKLEFRSGAAANLLFHTLNVYGLLGNHGRTYVKRIETIGDAPNPERQSALREDWWANYEKSVSTLISMDPHMAEVLIEGFGQSEDESLRLLSSALRDSWQKYRGYWLERAATLSEIVAANIKELPWRAWAEKMELVTGKSFPMDMVSISAEPLMESAMYVKPNICIGPIGRGNDFGFVHEGLHLLLNEDWAADARIAAMIPEGFRHHFWGDNWKGKFEQAVVVSLDYLIRNPRNTIEDYFEGCNVGDLFPYFFNPIAKWYELKIASKTQETITDVIYNILQTHKTELIDSQVNSAVRAPGLEPGTFRI